MNLAGFQNVQYVQLVPSNMMPMPVQMQPFYMQLAGPQPFF